MSEEVNTSLIKDVQSALGKYIKKPPLNEKLLKKPPFRYLHDVITSIIRETGFLNGLYSESELNSENVKDKDAKLNFLDKLITAVKKITGKAIAARSGKIIAGLEVNKTLELLLIIAKAIDDKDKVDSSPALAESTKNDDKKVQKPVKKDDKPEKSGIPKRKPSVEQKSTNKTNSSTKIEASKTKPPSKSDKLDTKAVAVLQDEKASLKRQDTEGSSKISEPTSSNKSSGIKEQTREKSLTRKNSVSDKSSASSKKTAGQSKSTPSRKQSLKETNKSLGTIANVIEEERDSSSRVKESTNGAEVEGNKAQEPNNQIITHDEPKAEPEATKITSTEPKTKTPPQPDPALSKNEKSPVKKKENVAVQRPGSARPGSRRVSYSNSLQNGEPENDPVKETKQEKKPDTDEPPSVPMIRPRTATRPPSARPGAPRIRDRGEVSVSDETKAPLANINVIEEGNADQAIDDKDNFIVIETEQNIPNLTDDPVQVNDQDQGQLVNQILQTQKELNESLTVDASQQKHSEIEWEAGRQRERDIVGKEVDKIRTVIQTLTSAANPLGKLFDFLQEDVDEMQRELQHWKKINENLQKQQLTEMNAGKVFLQPLQKQLEDVETSIREEYSQIANIKSTILSNDEKITRLINGVQTRPK